MTNSTSLLRAILQSLRAGVSGEADGFRIADQAAGELAGALVETWSHSRAAFTDGPPIRGHEAGNSRGFEDLSPVGRA